jgi:trehalose 6-phosphate synthase
VTERRILVASNRGPVHFAAEGGDLVARRGPGGLVSALAPVVQETGGLWVASAIDEGDRQKAAEGPGGRLEVGIDGARYRVRLVSRDEKTFHRYYNEISNRLLWFLHHYLWDLPRMPRLSGDNRTSWEAYRQVNTAFAEALAEEAGGGEADALVQDYHLSLVPAMLRERAPGVRIAHFHHVPFAAADYLRLLPRTVREELLTGLLGADLLGFHTERWAENFLGACRLLPGTDVLWRRRAVRWQGRLVRVGVYPIAIDAAQLRAAAASPSVRRRRRALLARRGDRALLLRVDRIDLSKNILRGFLAYEALLRARRRWRGRVTFLALLQPSRRGVPEYRAYADECRSEADRINAQLGTDSWTPIELRIGDDFDTVLAAYGMYDALLVNPVFDGMNLVAKEGPLLNRAAGALILSRTAGAHAELGGSAIGIDPVDVAGTSEAIAEALEMPREERTVRAVRLRRAAASRTPQQWVGRQLRDLERITRA